MSKIDLVVPHTEAESRMIKTFLFKRIYDFHVFYWPSCSMNNVGGYGRPKWIFILQIGKYTDYPVSNGTK